MRSATEYGGRSHPTNTEVTTPPTHGLRLEGLTVDYGKFRAIDGVSLELSPGTATALMGRNGAGKSSLLWAIQGGVRSSSGLVEAAGVDPRVLSPTAARKVVSLVPQTASDLLYLGTVAEECAQSDRESGAGPGTTAALVARLGSELPAETDPRDLSEGQRLTLVLAIQLAATPPVLLLDEPTRGLDYAMKHRLHQIIEGLCAAGTTVVISTHDVEFAALTTSRVVLLADGEIVADGDAHDVCTSSPAYSPQMAKVFAPLRLLTPDEVAAGL